MKHILFLVALVCALFASVPATAQNVAAKKDASGNYVQVDAPAKTVEELTAGCTKSGAKFTDKAGQTHDVYLAPSGKTFYIGTTKSGANAGKPRRVYFKTVGE
jgi:hypothetical protein